LPDQGLLIKGQRSQPLWSCKMADNKPSTAEAVDGAAPRLLEEAQREAAVSDVAQVFTLATPPFKITHVNNKWVQLCGFSAEEAVGRTCSLIQGPETSVQALYALRMAVAARASVTLRLLNYTKSGTPFINQLSLQPLREGRSESDPTTHYVGFLRAWRQPEPDLSVPQALQSPEEYDSTKNILQHMPRRLLDALTNEEPTVVTEATPPFRISHVNAAWCKQCGFTAEEAVGRTCRILQGPSTCTDTLRALKASALEHRQCAVKLVNYTKASAPPRLTADADVSRVALCRCRAERPHPPPPWLARPPSFPPSPPPASPPPPSPPSLLPFDVSRPPPPFPSSRAPSPPPLPSPSPSPFPLPSLSLSLPLPLPSPPLPPSAPLPHLTLTL
jgi:PAS domain S-box-containing protein